MKMPVVIVLCVLLCGAAVAQEASMLFEQANQLYRDGEYEKAAGIYERIIANGDDNPYLYFNLGNAYFKLQNVPAALLAFERAHKLAPQDDDISYNLHLANLRVIDKIEPLPRLFILDWWLSFLALLSPAGWAVAAISSLWAAALAGMLFYLLRTPLIQRIIAVAFLLLLGIAVIGFAGGYQLHRSLTADRSAILFAASAPIKSAPDEQSVDLFVLHEGVKMEILDQVGDWRKIRLADGKMGWILISSLREI